MDLEDCDKGRVCELERRLREALRSRTLVFPQHEFHKRGGVRFQRRKVASFSLSKGMLLKGSKKVTTLSLSLSLDVGARDAWAHRHRSCDNGAQWAVEREREREREKEREGLGSALRVCVCVCRIGDFVVKYRFERHTFARSLERERERHFPAVQTPL